MFKSPFKDKTRKLKRQSLDVNICDVNNQGRSMCQELPLEVRSVSTQSSYGDLPAKCVCNICSSSGDQSNMMILSCTHTFHTTCLLDNDFECIDKFCKICKEKLFPEEVAFMHQKFLRKSELKYSGTQDLIESLERIVEFLREELAATHCEVQKLSKQKEFSKKVMECALIDL